MESLTRVFLDRIPPAELKTNAFFDFGSLDFPNDYAVEGGLGSTYAEAYNNRMLGDAIPALSYPVGANHVTRLAPQGQPDRNSDMQATFENGWPSGRPPVQVGASAAGEWHHGDYQVVAYTYTYKLFNQIIALGNLK